MLLLNTSTMNATTTANVATASSPTQALLSRMSRLIGHAASNKKMIEEEKYCIDIINQNNAVIAALEKVNEEILNRHLHSCVKKAMQSNNAKRQKEVIQEILDIYHHTQR